MAARELPQGDQEILNGQEEVGGAVSDSLLIRHLVLLLFHTVFILF